MAPDVADLLKKVGELEMWIEELQGQVADAKARATAAEASCSGSTTAATALDAAAGAAVETMPMPGQQDHARWGRNSIRG